MALVIGAPSGQAQYCIGQSYAALPLHAGKMGALHHVKNFPIGLLGLIKLMLHQPGAMPALFAHN